VTLASLRGQPAATLLSNLVSGTAQLLTSITVNDATVTNQPVTLSQLNNSIGAYRAYYFWSGSNSTVNTSAKAMRDLTYGLAPAGTNAVTVSSNNQYIVYCSPAAGLTVLRSGTYYVNANMARVAGDALSLSAEIYIRATNGVETEITPISGTTAQAITTSPLEYVFTLGVASNVTMNATDSIQVKFKTSNVLSPPFTLNITAGALSVPIPSSQFVLVTEQVTTNTLTPTNMVSAYQTNATLSSLGGSTQTALNNVSNNLTTVSNTVTINATTNGYTSSSDKYGTNVVLTVNDGRLVKWTITNASNFAISTPAATNQTYPIRFEVTGTNTVTYATSNLLNSAALGCTNSDGNVFLFDWMANGAKWQGYRLR
jgi:hypothetical protein